MAFIIAGTMGVLSIVEMGQSMLKGVESPIGDFYTIRIENGDIQDASGNPPSVILTDFSDTQKYGVFEGTSKDSDECCRNNKILRRRTLPKLRQRKNLRERGLFTSKNKKLYGGIKRGEAPIRVFRTANGYNLKSIDLIGGSNPICISNIIVKSSDTQARRDEIFLPIGDLAYQCGYQWNWGANLGKVRQRCVWLNGNLDVNNKQIKSLHLDMQNIPGFFTSDTIQTLRSADITTLCSFIGDSSGVVKNRNDCQRDDPERLKKEENIPIEAAPVINLSSTEFSTSGISLDNFAGSGFVTSDNKIFNVKTKEFNDIQIADNPNPAAPSQVDSSDAQNQAVTPNAQSEAATDLKA
ncbi:hypothetical protein K3495_g12691 [Podosphaera aphanis]|nr:hypothetical protein K3495_g12691 [Podosphaera aphanis]